MRVRGRMVPHSSRPLLFLMLFVDLLVQGIVQGAIYALIALGLTLIYGLLRILHVAHAALFTLGGYVGVIVTNQTGSLGLALFASMISVGLLGMLIYRVAYRPLLDKPPLVALIASIGMFIAFEEVFRIVFGSYGLSFQNPPLRTQIELGGGMLLSYSRLLIIITAVSFLSVLAWLSSRTRTGVAWKATVTDPQMAASFGINIENVRYLNFFVGSALAGAAVINNIMKGINLFILNFHRLLYLLNSN